MTRYLTVEEVIKINGKVLGGSAQLRDPDLLEAAVGRPMASAFGEDAYPGITEKAAALFHSLINNHAFVDGNKRTATVAVIFFLEENGFRVIWEASAALDFILEIAQGRQDVPRIAAWLQSNIEPLLPSE